MQTEICKKYLKIKIIKIIIFFLQSNPWCLHIGGKLGVRAIDNIDKCGAESSKLWSYWGEERRRHAVTSRQRRRWFSFKGFNSKIMKIERQKKCSYSVKTKLNWSQKFWNLNFEIIFVLELRFLWRVKDDRAVQSAATLLPIIAPWEGSSEIDIREMRLRDTRYHLTTPMNTHNKDLNRQWERKLEAKIHKSWLKSLLVCGFVGMIYGHS